MASEQYNPSLVAGGMADPVQRKRMRAGSISGRLRTASDLEDMGMIDRHQKGMIKDLIISGDMKFQSIMDKYERGHKKELEDLIRSGHLGRRPSIDLLDNLDFDFLNDLKTDDLDATDVFGDDFLFDFSADPDSFGPGHAPEHARNPRTESMDSILSFSAFDNYHKDLSASDAGVGYGQGGNSKLMDELQFVRRNGGPGAGRLAETNTGSRGAGEGANGTAPSPHLSFSRYVRSIAPEGGDTDVDPAHRGRRGSWEITEQYLQPSIAHPHPFFQQQKQNQASPPDILPPPKSSSKKKAAGPSVSAGPPPKARSGVKAQVTSVGVEQYSPPPIPAPVSTGFVGSSSGPSAVGNFTAARGLPSTAVTGAIIGAGFIGAYSPEQRRLRIERFIEKRTRRVWTKKVKYDVRKNFADSRLRVKGRFVKKEDEDIMREILSI